MIHARSKWMAIISSSVDSKTSATWNLGKLQFTMKNLLAKLLQLQPSSHTQRKILVLLRQTKILEYWPASEGCDLHGVQQVTSVMIKLDSAGQYVTRISNPSRIHLWWDGRPCPCPLTWDVDETEGNSLSNLPSCCCLVAPIVLK